jgi:hypothetical protein
MFSPSFYIDSFQCTKKIITDQIFKDSTLNKAAHAYIDAQTAFAKVLVNNAIDVTGYMVDSLSSKLFTKEEKASQAPYKVEKEAK